MRTITVLLLLLLTGCTFVGNSPEERKHRKYAPIPQESQTRDQQ